MNNCRVCNAELCFTYIGYDYDFAYECKKPDHHYQECFNLNKHIYEKDVEQWIELTIDGKTYYGNDVLRVCQLKAFW